MHSGVRLRKDSEHGTWSVVPPLGIDDDVPQDELSDDELAEETANPRDPLWERPPARVARYILDTEKRLVCLRRHLVVLAEPVLSCVLGLAVVLWGAWQLRDVPYLPNVLFLAWVALLGRAVWKWLQWRGDWFIATDKRLLLTYGVVKRQVAMMPLSKVTDMSYNRSLLGRFLGYGELVMESAGQDQALSDVDRLPLPDQVYVRICEQLFGSVGEADVPVRRRSRVRRLASRAIPSRFR
jgi:uncharacterized membrane protein YdbT with pleckstrin-like domain